MTMRVDYDTGLSGPYARFRSADPAVLEAILNGGRVQRSSHVLEVGCGTGNYVAEVAERTACACSGIDPSEEMLTVARSRSATVRFQCALAERLPFDDQSFDFVFSVDVIHHIEDRTAAFSESLRVLRPRGTVAVVTDDEETIRARVHSRYFPETVGVELARYPSIPTLRAELASAGFMELPEQRTATQIEVRDPAPYREKAFSSLHLIPEEAFRRGLQRLTQDLTFGPIAHTARYVVLWDAKA